METQIKSTSRDIRRVFIGFWTIPVLLVLAGETLDSLTGQLAGEVRATYALETVAILLTAICVPLSLRMFAWMMAKKVDKVGVEDALWLYRLCCMVRLALLEVPVVAGLLTYYTTWSYRGVLCALIALTASLFCLPGEQRLRRELHIEKSE